MRPVEATEEALLAGTCTESLPERVEGAGADLGAAETTLVPLVAAGGGGRKDGLGSPEVPVERGG